MSLKSPKDGATVEVHKSNSGYKGPGKLLGLAYGNKWLVRIEVVEGDEKEETAYKTITVQEGNFTVVVDKKRNQ